MKTLTLVSNSLTREILMCVREEALPKHTQQGIQRPVAGHVKRRGGKCWESLVVKVLPLLKEVQECGGIRECSKLLLGKKTMI